MFINTAPKQLNLPNFLIIGAAKAGTTTLYSLLNQHPQIYMSPVKETNFFALENEKINLPQGTIKESYLSNITTNIRDYQEQFQQVSDELAIGEASPSYLYYPKAAERIQYYIPDVKMIAIFRNPIERAYSNFVHHLRDDLETTNSFADALSLEKERINLNWWWGFHYLEAGFYAVQLKRYQARFENRQIKVFLFEDLQHNLDGTLRNICQYLNVNPDFIPKKNLKYRNWTGVPKNRFFYDFLTTKNVLKEPFKLFFPEDIRDRIVNKLKSKSLSKPKLALEIKNQLINAYREDILELERMIDRDLSSWLK